MSKLSVYKIQLKIACLKKWPGTPLQLKANNYITASLVVKFVVAAWMGYCLALKACSKWV